eukprot:TRINITY_DN2712_c0_g1_i1.p1 TRINITY_DN2712_c0_g1~~TRINITY_DN2712_c0_g1_i1.p1  ORF type:complete len:369 (+),score=32.04 TRINITY_DN2712_c0_g1_i1:187-1293(+)
MHARCPHIQGPQPTQATATTTHAALKTVLLLSLCLGTAEAKWGVWPDGRPPEHPLNCPQVPKFDPWRRMVGRYGTLPMETTSLCPREQAVRSKSFGQTTRVFFENTRSEPVTLYWVGFNGDEKLVKLLAPGETVSEKTNEGHIFHARSNSNELLMRHTVGVYEFKNPRALSCPPIPLQEIQKHGHSPLECAHIRKGFKNSVGCSVNVFFWNGEEEELAFQLGTGAVPLTEEWNTSFGTSIAYEATYLTHRFYVRLLDGRLVEERRVGKVPIVDCSDPRDMARRSALKIGLKEVEGLLSGQFSGQLSFKMAPIGGKIKISVHCDSAVQVCDNRPGALLYTPPDRGLDSSSLLGSKSSPMGRTTTLNMEV